MDVPFFTYWGRPTPSGERLLDELRLKYQQIVSSLGGDDCDCLSLELMLRAASPP